MKAILHPNGSFRGLVSEDTPTDPEFTRQWVPTEPPAANIGHQVVEDVPTIGATQATQTWKQVPLPQVPVTKLTLKRRVSPEEWGALQLVLSQNPSLKEDFELASEIDPLHPATAATIDALYAADMLTTPRWVIFAP